jgi:hypothetical protein
MYRWLDEGLKRNLEGLRKVRTLTPTPLPKGEGLGFDVMSVQPLHQCAEVA